MKQMNEKTVTRVGLDYFPPTIKIEYTKGKSREQYHCRIHMNKYFNQFTSGFHHMSPVEQSMEVKAIVNALVDKHSELQQVPSKTFERMVEKLYLRHTQNNTIADNGVGDEYRDEQTTVTVRCSGDATRDGTLDYTLDEALDSTLNGTLDATLDVTSTGGLSYDTQANESCTTMSQTFSNLGFFQANESCTAMSQTQYSILSESSPVHIHDKNTHMSILKKTERLEGDADDLLEAMRLSKQKKQVGAEKNSGNKWSFPKKRVPTNSKLVIEYPTRNSSALLLQPPTAMAANKNISKQETMRQVTKPTNSAQGQEQNPQDKRGDCIWLEGGRAKKRLMDVANTQARQIELMRQAEKIKALIALEKAKEKKAKREALIFMKREKQERKRETKAAAKERKRETKAAKKLLLMQLRMEEKAAQIATRTATAKETKPAPWARELGYNSTAYQKNTRRGYDLPAHQKKTNEKIALRRTTRATKSSSEQLRLEMKNMEKELAQLKFRLSEPQSDPGPGEWEWEEEDGMDPIEKFLSCAPSWFPLPCATDRSYLSSATSERKKPPRRRWLPSQPSSGVSKSQTPRNRPNKKSRKKGKSRSHPVVATNAGCLALDKLHFI